MSSVANRTTPNYELIAPDYAIYCFTGNCCRFHPTRTAFLIYLLLIRTPQLSLCTQGKIRMLVTLRKLFSFVLIFYLYLYRRMTLRSNPEAYL
jgi:hypothetical protein